MKIILMTVVGIVFFFGLISCQNNSEQIGGTQTESVSESESALNASVSFSDETKSELEKYFIPSLIAKLDQYVLSYDQMTTDAEFEKNYRDAMGLFTEMYDAFDKPQTDYLKDLAAQEEYWDPLSILEDLEILNGQLGPIQISCVAECTQLDFLFDLKVYQEKAKTTSGEGDDDFIDLVIFMEGDYGFAAYYGFKSWYMPTWDYGGYSVLGDGILLEAINKSIAFEKKYKLFAAEILEIRKNFISALTDESDFGYSKEKILKEFDEILALNYFTKEELEDIMDLYNRIKKEDKELQFNCVTGDCNNE